MAHSKLEALRALVLEQFLPSLDPRLLYHDIAHTIDVMQACQALAIAEDLSESQIELLSIAALFHDVGFLEQYHDNESIAAGIARHWLTEFDFDAQAVETVARLVLATNPRHTPKDILEQIICDADLDYLGRSDYPMRSNMLRQEMASFGLDLNDEAWLESQATYLTNHQYYTATSRARRDAGKQRNLDLIRNGNQSLPT